MFKKFYVHFSSKLVVNYFKAKFVVLRQSSSCIQCNQLCYNDQYWYIHFAFVVTMLFFDKQIQIRSSQSCSEEKKS